MRLTFVETPLFSATRKGVLSDEALRMVQSTLVDDPESGAAIRGTNGARKMRVALEGVGKSGGARVIYVHVAARSKVYLLLVYTKSAADSISEVGRKALPTEVRRIQREE